MVADKSLAAEIEAVSVKTLAEAIRRQVVLLRFNEARTLDDAFDADEIELLCVRAANAVKDHVTDHPAIEDGARWKATGKATLAFGGEGTREWFRASDGALRSFPTGFDPNSGAYTGTVIVNASLQPEGERNA